MKILMFLLNATGVFIAFLLVCALYTFLIDVPKQLKCIAEALYAINGNAAKIADDNEAFIEASRCLKGEYND